MARTGVPTIRGMKPFAVALSLLAFVSVPFAACTSPGPADANTTSTPVEVAAPAAHASSSSVSSAPASSPTASGDSAPNSAAPSHAAPRPAAPDTTATSPSTVGASESSPTAPKPTIAAPRATRPPTAAPERLLHDVAWLADDLREGRRAGTSKALECADYVATRFASLGLDAAGTRGFFQEFDVPLEPRDGGRSSLASADAHLESGHDLAPLFCAEGGTVEGPVVFASFGIDDAERGRDDFAGGEFAGRIVVVTRGVPASPPPKVPTPKEGAASPHGTPAVTTGPDWGSGGLLFNKVMNAKRRGAVGVILLPAVDEPDASALPFGEGGSARAGIPCAMVSWKGARVVFGESTVTNWLADLHEAGTKRVPPPGKFTLSCDVARERGPARNVLARLRGTDPTRTIVVGAHYDHLGRGGEGSLAQGERGQIHNGADDNASGVAAVLEMARLLSTGPRPACNVVFALWSGEELGLLGSEHWALDPTLPLNEVAMNVNLDMVGRAQSGKLQVLAAGTAVPFAGWLAEAGPAAGLDMDVSTSGNLMGGSSDHATFLKRKIPALHLFTGLHGDYHKPSDDTDKFEAEGAARVTDLAVDLVRRACAAGPLAFVAPVSDPNAKPSMGRFRAWFGSIPNYGWDQGGVLIDGTSPGSPAEHAGLLKGDVLLRIGDIDLARIDDFQYALQTYKPGDVVRVKLRRDGAEQEVRVTLSTRGQQ